MKNLRSGRQYNLDLLKALAALSMVICHAVIRLGIHHEGYESDLCFKLGDVLFGDYLAVAHAFMMAMGFGIIFSSRSTPKYLAKRGLWIFLLGYILNMCRYGLFALIDGIISGEFLPETLEAIFGPDIFQFAGLALLVTAGFKKLKLNEKHILVISIILSICGSFILYADTKNYVLNLLLGQLFVTAADTSCFVFFNWYIFVAVGMVFGVILKKAENLDGLYKKILIVSGILAVIYIISTLKFGMLFLTREKFYYCISTLEAVGMLSIDFSLLSIFYFLLKKTGEERFKVFIELSKNITPFYFIHWCIIGVVDSIFGYLLEINFPYYVIFPFAIVVIIISFFAARAWKNHKVRKTEA